MRPAHYGKWGQRGKFKQERVPHRHCRWCGDPIPKGSRRRSYCGAQCAVDMTLRIVWGVMRQYIMDRDKTCRICGAWSYAPLHRFARRLERDTNAPYTPIEQKWHVDHIKAVSEGGTDDPNNLRLLCERDHKRTTKEWHGERAAKRRETKPHTLSLLA